MTKGDTLTVTIYAKDTGPAPTMLSFFLDIPTTFFTLVDQVSGTAGNQPFLDLGNFGGTNLLNSVATSDGVYQLNYIERHATSNAIATSTAIASFQLAVTGNTSSLGLDDNIVTWSSSSGRETAIVNPDGTNQSITFQSVAGNYMMAKPGFISGVIDLEGRSDSGQTVSVYVVPKGSLTPLTDSDYLSVNNDADGTDGIQLTLGSGGSYSLDRVPTGSYDVIVKKDSYIDELIEDVDVTPLTTASVNFSGADKLLAGDAAGYDHDGLSSTVTQPDNEIDITDISAISAAFTATSDSSFWNAFADIDGDGSVFVSDLNLSAGNQGKKASDDGDDLPFYKVIPGSNSGSLVRLERTGETAAGITYSVLASDLAHLRGYAVELAINSADWDVVGITDGLERYSSAYSLHRDYRFESLYVGVIMGAYVVGDNKVELMSLTLQPKVANPEAPALLAVTLVDGNGDVASAIISDNNALLPVAFSVSQNFPNPFNPTTNISFSLPDAGRVKLAIYNLLGQEIATLASGDMDPGVYRVVWNATDKMGQKVSTGMYFYRLTVDNRVVATKKMLLLK